MHAYMKTVILLNRISCSVEAIRGFSVTQVLPHRPIPLSTCPTQSWTRRLTFWFRVGSFWQWLRRSLCLSKASSGTYEFTCSAMLIPGRKHNAEAEYYYIAKPGKKQSAWHSQSEDAGFCISICITHSRWLALSCGMDFCWHSDCSPGFILTRSTLAWKLFFLAVHGSEALLSSYL